MTPKSQNRETRKLTPFRTLSNDGLNRIRRMYEAITPTRATLALLFGLDAAQTGPSEAWRSFFVETAGAQLIWDERPTGVLSEQDACWILARFDETPSIAVMAILVHLLEEAHRKPTWFEGAVRTRAAVFRPDVADPNSLTVRRSAKHLRLVV